MCSTPLFLHLRFIFDRVVLPQTRQKINLGCETMKKQTIFIQGMHCRSCEILIEEGLKDVAGIRGAKVNYHKGTAEIAYKGHLDAQAVQTVITESGYTLGRDTALPLISTHQEDWNQLSKVAVVLIGLYFIAQWLGIFNLSGPASNNFSSLPVVFLVGITAGISTCMALVGGLVLGAAARFAKLQPLASPWEKFSPHIFFNLGRIIAFFILGGIIGWVGSILQLSLSVTGFLTILVGLSMLLIGAQLTEVFPRLSHWQFTLPKGLSRILGFNQAKQAEYSHQNAMSLGALTFFLPCGFTQSMQLYAMSTGSPIAGALTMGVFALGTAPGLLGIGGLTSIVKGAQSKYFFKFAGLVVMALAIFNISNGLRLTGFDGSILGVSSQTQEKTDGQPKIQIDNGIQVVKMTQNSRGYVPNTFTIKKGVKVKWVVTSTDPYTCANSLVSRQLNLRQNLISGENIIEFTPTEVGKIAFSCSMGMYSGSFNVVD